MRYGHGFRFGFGFSPFGFWLRGPRYFPRKEEYIRMLEEYKKELEDEIRDVEQKIIRTPGIYYFFTSNQTGVSSFGLSR